MLQEGKELLYHENHDLKGGVGWVVRWEGKLVPRGAPRLADGLGPENLCPPILRASTPLNPKLPAPSNNDWLVCHVVSLLSSSVAVIVVGFACKSAML